MLRISVIGLVLCIAPIASYAQQLDSECRPMPLPGYIMAPQPQNPECLQRQQVALRDAQERRQQEEISGNIMCSQASADDIRNILDRNMNILDVTSPHYVDGQCLSEAMTDRGEIRIIVGFKKFNGRTYVTANYLRF